MRKQSILLAFSFIVLTTLSLQAQDFEYATLNNEVKITKYIGHDPVITVPSHIDAYPVTTIGYEAFGECQVATKIILPETIITIEKGAFTWCRNLKEIILPDSIQSIGGGAFSDCGKLESIKLPNSLTRIEENTFLLCVSLRNITIPRTIVSIGNSAFQVCKSLTEINIPRSIQAMGSLVFADCNRLQTIYCEIAEKPKNWQAEWNISNIPVNWGTIPTNR